MTSNGCRNICGYLSETNIDNDLHGRRLALTQNDVDNGFELWRALFIENEGGAEQVALGGMSNLHSFPQCPRIDDLQHWLGQWQMTRQKYGADLPETHLKQMFLNMLPSSVSEKLRERRDLTTLQQYINEIDMDLGRLNDAKLARIHAQRMSSSLKTGSRSSVNAVVDDSSNNDTGGNVNDEINKKLDTLISVLSPKPGATRGRSDDKSQGAKRSDSRERSKSPRGLDPGWAAEGKGCLHCGMRGHKRKECSKFKKLLAENNNSLPSGYKGAYEKWKEQKKKTSVAAIATDDDDDIDEFPETQMVWSLPTRANLAPLTCRCCPISNSFDGLSEDDQDDEDEVMAALQQLTPHVTSGPKLSQAQRKAKSYTKKQIADIARKVQSGEIDLPDLDLESNETYEAVWALVDSGAGKSCARKAKHFSNIKTPNKPSQAKMATANGQELKSRGTFTVNALSKEGQAISAEFEDVDVDMPIIAVNDLSKEATEVIFRQENSELVDVGTGRRSRFTKKRGVYFMKMFYKKNQCHDQCDHDQDMDFHRPGNP